MDDELFSDGIGTITVIGTTVRVDFVSLSPTEREPNGQPKAVFKQRIVMSVDGFVRSASKVQEAVQALSKMGAAQPQQTPGTLNVPTTLTPRGGDERVVEPTTTIAPTESAPLQRAGAGAQKPPFP